MAKPAEKRDPHGGRARWTRVSLRAQGVAVLTFPIAALFVALFSVYWADENGRYAEALVSHSYDVRVAVLRLRGALADGENAADAYAATHQETYRAAYAASRAEAGRAMADLKALLGENDADAAGIRRLTSQALSLFAQRVAGGGSGSQIRVVGDVEARLARLADAEERISAAARAARDETRRRQFRIVVVCGVCGPMGALFIHLLLAGRVLRRMRALEENARRLAHGLPLEGLPRGSDEIADLARRLEEASHLLRSREKETRDSESRYREFFDQAPIPYEETDREGVVRRFNQAVSNLLKTAPDQLLGYRAWDFVAPDQQESFRAAMLERIASGEEGGNFNCDLLLEDGTRIGVEIRETFIRDDNGRVTAVLRSLTDVTERNIAAMAARKVEQYALELRNRNEQLGHALEAARNAVAAKGRFLAGVSHELRTPLNAIIGFAEILYDGRVGEVSEDHKECLSDILVSARHLLQLINDILDLAKVEAGKMEFRPEVSKITLLVEEVRDVIRPLAEKGGQQLVLDVIPGLTAFLDPGRFKQVLYNYLSNAVKFTPAGGVVTVRVGMEGSDAFRLEVEDTGIGIPAEEVARLFQEFQQIPNSKKAGQGTGLGLALTRHIVEAQGGTVAVRSTPGKGSVFSAVFPLHYRSTGITTAA
jgi:PAS domain S-box-containing protein